MDCRHELNRQFYGRAVSPCALLGGGSSSASSAVPPPRAALPLYALLDQLETRWGGGGPQGRGSNTSSASSSSSSSSHGVGGRGAWSGYGSISSDAIETERLLG